MSRTVFVVDDEPDICFALSLYLPRFGWSVRTAGDGAQALALMERLGMPDVMLLDMKMPVMDGWEFVRALRMRFAHLCPLVVMTAAAAPEERARAVGAVAVVEKPFLLEDVRAALEDAVAATTRTTSPSLS